MPHDHHKVQLQPSGRFYKAGSRIYFSRETERKFFFILTLAMLVLGVLTKLGWL